MARSRPNSRRRRHRRSSSGRLWGDLGFRGEGFREQWSLEFGSLGFKIDSLGPGGSGPRILKIGIEGLGAQGGFRFTVKGMEDAHHGSPGVRAQAFKFSHSINHIV